MKCVEGRAVSDAVKSVAKVQARATHQDTSASGAWVQDEHVGGCDLAGGHGTVGVSSNPNNQSRGAVQRSTVVTLDPCTTKKGMMTGST